MVVERVMGNKMMKIVVRGRVPRVRELYHEMTFLALVGRNVTG